MTKKKDKQTKTGQDAETSRTPETPETENAPDAEEATPEEAVPEETAPETSAPRDLDQDPETVVQDLNDKLLRALAETENMRRRAQRDKEDATKYAIANFAREMLSVGDNLRRAMDSVDAEIRGKDAAVEQIMVGLEMTEREIQNIFERFGIKTIQALGEKFDHNLHEAMFEIEDPSKPAGTVVQEVETGFVLNDRLLRPAKVGVSKGGPKEDAKDAPGDAPKDAGAAPPPAAEDPAVKEGQAAYEDKSGAAGRQLDEEL